MSAVVFETEMGVVGLVVLVVLVVVVFSSASAGADADAGGFSGVDALLRVLGLINFTRFGCGG